MDVKSQIQAVAMAGVVSLAGVGIYEGTVSIGPVDSVAPNEVVSLRTEYTETFTADSLHWQTVSSRTPMHYRAEGETEWKKIDTSVKAKPVIKKLVAKITGGRQYEVNSGVYDAEFYGEGKEHNYRFERNGASIEYEATFDTTGVVFTVEPKNTGVKETLTLSEGATTRFSWTVTVTDGTIRPDGAGWVVINYDGVEAFRIPAVTAHGADGKPVRVISALDGEILTAVIDTTGAVWPVTVDPSTVIATDTDAMSGTLAAYAVTGQEARNKTTANYYVDANSLVIGEQNPSAYYHLRSLVRFSIGTFTGVASIDSAKIKLVVSTVPASATDSLKVCAAVDTLSTGYFNAGMYTRFKGWAASGAYSPTYLSDKAYLNSALGAGDTLTYKLNSSGLASVYSGNIFQCFILNSKDISDNYAESDTRLQDDSPYLTVYYTAVIPNTVYTSTYNLENVNTHKKKDSIYGGARGEYSSAYITTTTIDTVGQRYVGSGDFRNYRISFQTPTLNQWNAISSAKVILNGVADGSTTDFKLCLASGSWATPDAQGTHFYTFQGWLSGLNKYTSAVLSDTTLSTSVFSAGPDTLNFNAAGLTKLILASQDTARFVLLSSRDIAALSPSGDEFVTFGSTAPRLVVTWALNDSIPADFAMNAMSPDSILVTWRDRTWDESGFEIVDAATGAKIDSVGAGVTSRRVGGFGTNSKHAWKVKVCGGVYADSVSAADSCFTKANTPGAPTRTAPTDSTTKIVIDANGNPSYTAFAIAAVDSAGDTTHVDFSRWPRRLLSGAPRADSVNHWAIRDSIGGASGVTVATGVGKWHKWVVKALSDQ